MINVESGEDEILHANAEAIRWLEQYYRENHVAGLLKVDGNKMFEKNSISPDLIPVRLDKLVPNIAYFFRVQMSLAMRVASPYSIGPWERYRDWLVQNGWIKRNPDFVLRFDDDNRMTERRQNVRNRRASSNKDD